MKDHIFSITASLFGLSSALLLTPLSSPIVGVVAFLSFLFLGSALTRSLIADYKHLSFPVFLAMLSIIFSAYYYAMPVSSFGFYVIGVALLAALYLLHAKFGDGLEIHFEKPSFESLASAVALILFFIYLQSFGFVEAVRSPFDQVPVASLALIAGLAILCAVSVIKNKSVVTLPIFLLAGTSIAAIVYKLGYGFDPFIHRATLQHIAEFGTITPKPLYYTGEYVIELLANLAFQIPLFSFNVFFVPILSAVFFYFGAKQIQESSGLKPVSYLAFLLIPFSAFLSTTPQALAYLFSLLSFTLLFEKNKSHEGAFISGLLAVAAMLAHPLAGVAAILSSVLYALFCFKKSQIRNLVIAATTLAGSLALPVMFILQSAISGNSIGLKLQTSEISIPVLQRLFSPSLDILYSSYFFILPIFIAGAIIFLIKERAEVKIPASLMFFMLSMNYLLMKFFIQFDFLIEYERQNYTDRIIVLMWLLLIPTLAFVLSRIGDQVKNSSLPLALLFTLLATSGVYAAYPQDDGFRRSSGFNVSEYDIQAARSINALHDKVDYAVLSNQSVAAAALQEFGFEKYYQGDTFYYPIPTGGALYQIYLKMAEEDTSKQTIEEAFELIPEAETIYFVLNDYWWGAEVIAEKAKKEADSWFAIGPNEDVFVFTFRR